MVVVRSEVPALRASRMVDWDVTQGSCSVSSRRSDSIHAFEHFALTRSEKNKYIPYSEN